MTEMIPSDEPELWQLYDDAGQPLPGRSATKDETFAGGLLHAAAHVWIWRIAGETTEVLLQRRAAIKRTWPNLYDVSAAGHIDLDETPVEAAIRETREELGWTVQARDLQPAGIHRAHLQVGNNIENEFQYLYTMPATDHDFTLQTAEVGSVMWKPLDDFAAETGGNQFGYVPHSPEYYAIVCAALRHTSKA